MIALVGTLVALSTVHVWGSTAALILFYLGAGCWLYTGTPAAAEAEAPAGPARGRVPPARRRSAAGRPAGGGAAGGAAPPADPGGAAGAAARAIFEATVVTRSANGGPRPLGDVDA